ncbi:DJ-1/PfpI family protein, partial [Escherichia coli]|nr:DJ-1/PfpI family protein [Escherichia coli]
MSASALVCLAPGSEETEAVTTIDLQVRGGIKVTTASVASDGNLAITCSRGFSITLARGRAELYPEMHG